MSMVVHSLVGYVVHMDTGLALVTIDGGVVVLDVAEVDGVLVDVASGRPVDLVSVVVVTGLPELVEA